MCLTNTAKTTRYPYSDMYNVFNGMHERIVYNIIMYTAVCVPSFRRRDGFPIPGPYNEFERFVYVLHARQCPSLLRSNMSENMSWRRCQGHVVMRIDKVKVQRESFCGRRMDGIETDIYPHRILILLLLSILFRPF